MQFEQMMTILAPELESGNSTDAGDKASISSTTDYFNMMFPVMMSMGYGGTFMAFAYHILYRIRLKIWSKLYNSIHIKYNDDTFKWVNRYIKDMGYVVDTNGLVCGLKKEDEDEWYIQIFKKKDIEVWMLPAHLDETCMQKLADESTEQVKRRMPWRTCIRCTRVRSSCRSRRRT